MIIPIHEIQVLHEREAYYIIKKYYEKGNSDLNYGDTIRLLNQFVLKRHFRQTGEEHWEWIHDSYFSECLTNIHKQILLGLKLRKLIRYEEKEFLFDGKKYKFKGKEILVKINNKED